jgi:hypothetical protein
MTWGWQIDPPGRMEERTKTEGLSNQMLGDDRH